MASQPHSLKPSLKGDDELIGRWWVRHIARDAKTLDVCELP